MINYPALKTELLTDPAALGYSGPFAAGQDQTCATLLNAVGAGAAFSLFKPTIATTDVQACLDPTEFTALTSTQLSQLTIMLAGGSVNTGAASVRTIMAGIFTPSGSFPNTRAALVAIAKQQGSRAEVLFGVGTVIQHSDIAKARVS
jgi:hypothetical protein